MGSVLAAVVVIGIVIAVRLRTDDPTPISELMPDDARIDLDDYDGSMAEGAPKILVLGTPHFAQEDYGYAESEFTEVIRSLSRFKPDLVAVEYLPGEWPPGVGRDYRPELPFEKLADSWGMSADDAERRIDSREVTEEGCQRGRAHFVVRDLVNAGYWWSRYDCKEISEKDAIAQWWEEFRESEHARLGYSIAERHDLPALVPFDDQSADAQWFLHEVAPRSLLAGRFDLLWDLLPDVNRRSRELAGFTEEHDNTLPELLHALNSPERIARQYWAYEHSLPTIDFKNAGQRQLDKYWTRNERMFARLDDAAEEHAAERILAITGAGHKYFLDELARDADYRWIDPREYLPTP